MKSGRSPKRCRIPGIMVPCGEHSASPRRRSRPDDRADIAEMGRGLQENDRGLASGRQRLVEIGDWTVGKRQNAGLGCLRRQGREKIGRNDFGKRRDLLGDIGSQVAGEFVQLFRLRGKDTDD